MASVNKVIIVGNLGRDPEMRYTPNGRPVTQFNVAVNQSTKNQQSGEWVEATDWFRVSIWGDRGERAAENLRKGSRVFVDGRFRTREYEANDGQKRISLDITADTVLSTTRIDTPASRTNRIVCQISSRISGAKPSVASSKMSKRGLVISARPIASICCSPPDR